MNSQYNEFISIADKADEMANYLADGIIRIDQSPVEALLILYDKLCKEGLADPETFTLYIEQLKSNLTNNDSLGVASLIKSISGDIRDSINSYNEIIASRIRLSKLNYDRNLERNKRESLNTDSRNKLSHSSPFQGRGVVYSCITGGYDALRDPLYIDDDLDYIFFTDSKKTSSDIWEIRELPDLDSLSPQALARSVKLFPWKYLPEYDYSIWIDGKIQQHGSISEYIGLYSVSSPMLCFNHYECIGINDEANLIIKMGKEDPDIVSGQLSSYRKEGYPDDINAVDTCILVRDHSDELLRKVMSDWWEELTKWSMRDQLSFGYVCWKNGLIYDTSPLYVYDNPFFSTHPHN